MTDQLVHRPAPAETSEKPGPLGSEPGQSGRRALVRLFLAVSMLVLVAAWAGALATVAVVGAFIGMVMLHELGHYVMAKRAGMKVTDFFFGFGPTLWSVRRGETVFGVKLFPLGGFVKVPGMTNLDEVDPVDEPRSYRAQGFWARFGMSVAGSTTHFLLAFAMLLVLNLGVGNPIHTEVQPVVGSISKLTDGTSPAEAAGLQVGDRIVAVGGVPLQDWMELPPRIRASAGQKVELDVVRKGQQLRLTAVPADRRALEKAANPDLPEDQLTPADRAGFLGVGPSRFDPTVGPVQAVGRSVLDLGRVFQGTLSSLKHIASIDGLRGISDNVSGNTTSTDAQGSRFLSPVGLVNVASQTVDEGIGPVLVLFVLLNVFVGVFNLLPLLPFDGGHIAIAFYEAIRSRGGKRYQADAAKLLPVAYLTVLALIAIGATSLYVDLRSPLRL